MVTAGAETPESTQRRDTLHPKSSHEAQNDHTKDQPCRSSRKHLAKVKQGLINIIQHFESLFLECRTSA